MDESSDIKEKIQVIIKKLDTMGVKSPKNILRFIKGKEYNPFEIVELLLPKFSDELTEVLSINTNNITYKNVIKALAYPEYSVLVTSMKDCFLCGEFKEIDMSKYDTSHVTDMSAMFCNCAKLTKINLSNFDTSSVANMTYMFSSCISLEELDLSNFDTSKVTNMSYMFYKCNSLKKIELSGFDTSKVTNMNYMFYDCKSLTNVDVSSFNTSKLEDVRGMFLYCRSLKDLPIFHINNTTIKFEKFHREIRI